MIGSAAFLFPEGVIVPDRVLSALDDELQCCMSGRAGARSLNSPKNGGILERWSMRRALSMRGVRLTSGSHPHRMG